MSVWSTRTFDRDRNYIVIKHNLPGINSIINGVKFRESYAVVEKDSKTYFTLKKIAVLKNPKEFPLTFLQKLPFITRSLDVKMIYGHDVYVKYKKVMDEEKAKAQKTQNELDEIVHLGPEGKCKFRFEDNSLCKIDRIQVSPAGYCHRHLYEDSKLAELGIEVPKFVLKSEKKEVKDRIIAKLAKLKEEGKF